MDLLRGITGFQSRKDASFESPHSDLAGFRSHCHYASREVGAKVRIIQDPNEAAGFRNFTIARFDFSNSTVAVLLNVIHPIVGFANWPTESQILFEYIDHQRLAEVFGTLGNYTVATCKELNQPLLREMCRELTPTELKQVRYFRPERVGDVVFNYWD
jgi:hypothetical protein